MQNVERLASAVFRAQSRLFGLQQPEGFWVGELEANSTLCSDYVAFMHWSACIDPDRQSKCVDHLLSAQLPNGGWSTYPGGPARLDPTVKAYFALKLAGFESSDPRMDRAANLVRGLGGIEHSRSYTRFYLALLGQVRWQDVPPIPIEVVLAPRWCPLNLYSVSAWTRVMMVPLGIIRHFEPTHAIPPERGIPELFITPERRVRSITDDWFSRGLTLLAWAHHFGIFPSRKAALAVAEQWMLERMGDGCSGLGGIFPSMLQALVALRCLGYATQSATYRKAEAAFEQLFVDDANGFRIQPCLSPTWDTALSIISLTESGVEPQDPSLQKAVTWLAARRVTIKGDWAVNNPGVEPSGWSFEFQNPYYPDVDDAALVVLALEAGHFGDCSAMQRSLDWLMSFQCQDGGWAAFDRNVQNPLLLYLPFADHRAILDPSCPDITAHTLEVFGEFRIGLNHPRVHRALHFLKARQQQDGSWYGRWGVNYLYGTSHVLRGLRAVGVNMHEGWVERGRRWLEAHQNADGGWGESCLSYLEPGEKGRGESTASQTAWALMGLCAFPEHDRPSIHRGVAYLLNHQNSDGTWSEVLATGTGFPGVLYLRYDYYPVYWPLRALAIYASALRRV